VAAALQLPQIVGRAILIATLINADGFLTFMLADFTALSPALRVLVSASGATPPAGGSQASGPASSIRLLSRAWSSGRAYTLVYTVVHILFTELMPKLVVFEPCHSNRRTASGLCPS
jgi:hypothetical protein